jgi:branched-chain amino acid transport system ATP-binding protein
MAILTVENLSTGYGKKQVLFNVSLEVNKGDIVLLAGSNGSGKSTLLKAIYGMLPQWDNGRVVFDGENITGKPTAALLKKGLLYIPQKNNLFEELTVKENLEMAGLTLDKKVLWRGIEEALSVFKTLEPNLKRTPMTLSGGERQLLTLAMATLHQPKMILVDEPFTGLSPQNIDFGSW